MRTTKGQNETEMQTSIHEIFPKIRQMRAKAKTNLESNTPNGLRQINQTSIN
jgi:hypothetical protein